MSSCSSKPPTDGFVRLLERLASAETPAARRTEAALLERLRASDEQACETVVRRHGAGLLAAARRLLPTEEEAREAVREAFSAAFRSAHGFIGEPALSPCLHRHLLDATLRRLRTEIPAATDGIEALLPRFDSGGAHAEAIESWEAPRGAQELTLDVVRRVQEAVTKLPPRHRAALVLRDVEGLTAAETAAILERRPDEVERLLHQAHQALRGLLAPAFARGSRRRDH